MLPNRQTEGEEVLNAEFEIDEKTGRPKPLLVLRLDYFPSPKPGTTTLPVCFRKFPTDFALGRVSCLGSDVSVDLYAKHVDQDCYTNANYGRKKASEPLLLAGCESAAVYTFAYDPEIRIDVEVR